MATALFLSYNSIGQNGEYPNGVLEENGHKAIIVQHPRGKNWAVPGVIPMQIGTALAETAVEELFKRAFGTDVEPDAVLVYVGAEGSEGAIRLAAHLPQDKVGFVMCDCNMRAKAQMLHQHADHQTHILMCECGGQQTMGGLVKQFLQTGAAWSR